MRSIPPSICIGRATRAHPRSACPRSPAWCACRSASTAATALCSSPAAWATTSVSSAPRSSVRVTRPHRVGKRARRPDARLSVGLGCSSSDLEGVGDHVRPAGRLGPPPALDSAGLVEGPAGARLEAPACARRRRERHAGVVFYTYVSYTCTRAVQGAFTRRDWVAGAYGTAVGSRCFAEASLGAARPRAAA